MDVLTKLTMMKFRDSPTVPTPILFVKATSRGRYLVLFLTIVPLLVLGADQTLKVSTKSIQTFSDVTSL